MEPTDQYFYKTFGSRNGLMTPEMTPLTSIKHKEKDLRRQGVSLKKINR